MLSYDNRKMNFIDKETGICMLCPLNIYFSAPFEDVDLQNGLTKCLTFTLKDIVDAVGERFDTKRVDKKNLDGAFYQYTTEVVVSKDKKIVIVVYTSILEDIDWCCFTFEKGVSNWVTHCFTEAECKEKGQEAYREYMSKKVVNEVVNFMKGEGKDENLLGAC